MAIIDSLKDKLGNIIYPKTLTKAVYDAETEDRLDNLLNQKAESDIVNSHLSKSVLSGDEPHGLIYEKGEWTPTLHVIQGGDNEYSIQQGEYIRIGDLLTLVFRIKLSNATRSGGDVTIDGFPYDISESLAFGSISIGNINSRSGSKGNYAVHRNGPYLRIYESFDDEDLGANVTRVRREHLTDDFEIRGSVTIIMS